MTTPQWPTPGPSAPPPPPAWEPAPPPGRHIGLIAGLAVAVALLLCVVGVLSIAFIARGATDPEPPRRGPLVEGQAPLAPATGSPVPPGSPADGGVVAQDDHDFDVVCKGGSVANAADYRKGRVKLLAFSDAHDIAGPWGSETVEYDRPYELGQGPVTSVSVVACLRKVAGSEGKPRACAYSDQNGKAVSVSLVPVRYRLTFHAAKTGDRLADGGVINGPSAECPSMVLYNASTRRTYARPDDGALTAAFDRFTRA
jgi:hypothetical protein